MPWEGTHEQHEALLRALEQVFAKKEISRARLATIINADSRARQTHIAYADGRGPKAQVIDDGTFGRWLKKKSAEEFKSASNHKKKIVYEFLER